ncbi:fumarylacetoacetate hydrolase family protein [Saccharomonospora saliphila]|uniref:fumarylacetoacetate hydrolase family protein n=1 Tax=Saccharomonospora saliphila TaxID=369829 RepID=UPI00038299D3|nr:fumarylacetoacetate hydrolase family protein [Saccharomonospora saliphila]
MKLATLRVGGVTTAARVDGGHAVELPAPDVGTLLRRHDWRAEAAATGGARHELSGVDYAPVVPEPGKIVCVGLNYRNHILEMGRELPEYPTLFAKYPEALIGARDPVVLPAASGAVDWEAELAIVVGERVRHAGTAAAERAIAGYSVLNDVTARDFQYRTKQWLQGKTFEATTPFGPHLVTTDEADLDAEITTEVDGEVMQRSTVADLVFGPAELVSYISGILPLNPGDVIASGTPGGVGHARTPARYLTEGSTLVTRVAGIGELVNVARAE